MSDILERLRDIIRESKGARSVWKCPKCFHANKGGPEDVCYWCGCAERVALNPVGEANAQQNTPNYDTLVESIETEEASRTTDRPLNEQVAELVAKYLEEKQLIIPPAGTSAEKGEPCQKLSKPT